MRYFFLSFNYTTKGIFSFVNLTCAFKRFPTQKECKDVLADQKPHAQSIVLLGVTELTKSDYEIFTREL